MEERHVGLTLNELKEKQEAIDGLIDSLLKFTPAPVTNSTHQQRRTSVGNGGINTASAGTSNSPSASQTKKSRGRPPKPNPPSPGISASAPIYPVNSIVECLNKINEQNKKLLNFVEVLADKVENNSVPENVTVSQTQNESPVSVERNSVLNDVSVRLEKIEQNLNANTLICRGPTVEKLVKESVSGETTNLELLKGKVCATVCGEEVTEINVRDLQLSLYGHDKKSIRLNCANLGSKIHLLKQARLKKTQRTLHQRISHQ